MWANAKLCTLLLAECTSRQTHDYGRRWYGAPECVSLDQPGSVTVCDTTDITHETVGPQARSQRMKQK